MVSSSSHAEHAELGRLRGRAASEFEQQAHHVSGFQWVDHHVAPGVAGEVVGGHKVREVRVHLVVAFVVEALDRSVLDGAVHPL